MDLSPANTKTLATATTAPGGEIINNCINNPASVSSPTNSSCDCGAGIVPNQEAIIALSVVCGLLMVGVAFLIFLVLSLLNYCPGKMGRKLARKRRKSGGGGGGGFNDGWSQGDHNYNGHERHQQRPTLARGRGNGQNNTRGTDIRNWLSSSPWNGGGRGGRRGPLLSEDVPNVPDQIPQVAGIGVHSPLARYAQAQASARNRAMPMAGHISDNVAGMDRPRARAAQQLYDAQDDFRQPGGYRIDAAQNIGIGGGDGDGEGRRGGGRRVGPAIGRFALGRGFDNHERYPEDIGYVPQFEMDNGHGQPSSSCRHDVRAGSRPPDYSASHRDAACTSGQRDRMRMTSAAVGQEHQNHHLHETERNRNDPSSSNRQGDCDGDRVYGQPHAVSRTRRNSDARNPSSPNTPQRGRSTHTFDGFASLGLPQVPQGRD